MEAFESIAYQLENGGAKAVEELVARQESESLYLDYKRTATKEGARNLDQDDKDNLAKAISGFGNSSGGVIIWGVDCRRDKDGLDVPSETLPVADVALFRSLLDQYSSRLTMPAHGLVRHVGLQFDHKPNGFVISIIPPSPHIPIQTISGRQQIYIRAGTDFLPAPYDVLAGMFGTRPLPRLMPFAFIRKHSLLQPGSETCEVMLTFALGVKNIGRGVAGDYHVIVTLEDQARSNSTMFLQPNADHQFSRSVGKSVSYLSAHSLGGGGSGKIIPTERRFIGEITLRISEKSAREAKGAFAFEIVMGSETSAANAIRASMTDNAMFHFFDQLLLAPKPEEGGVSKYKSEMEALLVKLIKVEPKPQS